MTETELGLHSAGMYMFQQLYIYIIYILIYILYKFYIDLLYCHITVSISQSDAEGTEVNGGQETAVTLFVTHSIRALTQNTYCNKRTDSGNNRKKEKERETDRHYV